MKNTNSPAWSRFYTCFHCGNIAHETFNKWGRPTTTEQETRRRVFCSESCAHNHYGRPTPRQSNMDTAEAMHNVIQITKSISPGKRRITKEAQDISVDQMLIAVESDKRLPRILHMIADGKTQEQIARRLRVTQPMVSYLLRKWRTLVRQRSGRNSA